MMYIDVALKTAKAQPETWITLESGKWIRKTSKGWSVHHPGWQRTFQLGNQDDVIKALKWIAKKEYEEIE